MNGRERFNAITHFKPFDRVLNREFGYWAETVPKWAGEGLPAAITNEAAANKYFGFDKFIEAKIPLGLFPLFEPKLLETGKEYNLEIDSEGVTKKVFTSGASMIPHNIDYSLKDRASWKEFKKRLVPGAHRYPENWKKTVAKLNDPKRDYPAGLSVGSLLGVPRNWMGFENCAMMFYDDPELMREIVETMGDVIVGTIEPALKEVKFDYADMWEDIAFKNGPMISPEMFKEFIIPQYKRISALLRKYGVDVCWVDCDGDINSLVPLWLEAGINGMFPLEVGCFTDPVALRKKYGKDVLLFGGVNKRELAKSKKEIDAEVNRLRSLVEGGGFVPHVDHRCPPDVSYENYKYYLKKKKEVFGISDWIQTFK